MTRDAEDGARVILLPGAALSEADDATLARALIGRDPRAPRVLWQRFAPMVFRMLRRTLGSDHDLDDLAQEVFLCVFEKVRALREPQLAEHERALAVKAGEHADRVRNILDRVGIRIVAALQGIEEPQALATEARQAQPNGSRFHAQTA